MSRGIRVLTEAFNFVLSPADRLKLEVLSASAGGKMSKTIRALIANADEHDVRSGLAVMGSVKRPTKRGRSIGEHTTRSN